MVKVKFPSKLSKRNLYAYKMLTTVVTGRMFFHPPTTTTTSPSNEQPGQEEVDDDYQQERRDVDDRKTTTDQEQREFQQLKRSRLQSKTNSQNRRSSKLVVATPTKVEKIDLSGQERKKTLIDCLKRHLGDKEQKDQVTKGNEKRKKRGRN